MIKVRWPGDVDCIAELSVRNPFPIVFMIRETVELVSLFNSLGWHLVVVIGPAWVSDYCFINCNVDGYHSESLRWLTELIQQ